MGKILAVSIRPNQVIFPDFPIFLKTDIPMDPKSVQSALQIEDTVGKIQITDDGKKAIIVPKKMEEGVRTLHIDELIFSDGTATKQILKIKFFFINSKAKIPDNMTVQSFSRIAVLPLATERISLNRSSKNKYIEIMKAVDNKTGKPKELAFDHVGKPINANKIFKKIYENHVKKFGKLHETLYKRLGKSANMDVAIWLRIKEPQHSKEKAIEMPPYERELRKQIDDIVGDFEKNVLTKFETRTIRRDRAAPVVYTTLTKNQVLKIAKYPEVVRIFLHEPKGFEDLSNSISIANSDDVHSDGINGNGVRVAIWETGPDKKDDLIIAEFYDSSESNKAQHARLTTAIIKNNEKDKPHGHAPSCETYSANKMDLDALRWAVREKQCTVISQSFHRDSEQTDSSLSYDDIYKDWLVLHWPYPTILQAAGNGDSNEYVNHKGYNSVSVGSHNDNADAMASDSVFRNPSSTHVDRELPEICANGIGVSAVGLTMSGTSFAAPATAGVTALLQSIDSTLKYWPEGCRAILFAGARRNVSDNTWWQDVLSGIDAHDGTGALDAHESSSIAKNRKSRNNAAVPKAWDVGTLSSADFNEDRLSNFSYQINIPRNFGMSHVKVALAWDSKVSTLNIFGIELPLESALTVDFDLMIFDSANNSVGYSGSWNNSYEIAEFDGVPGQTYTIKIRRWSGTDSVWYGIAWTTISSLVAHPLPDKLQRERLVLPALLDLPV